MVKRCLAEIHFKSFRSVIQLLLTPHHLDFAWAKILAMWIYIAANGERYTDESIVYVAEVTVEE